MTTTATTATTTDAELMDLDEALRRYDPVIGLEVHVELNTVSKMFCGCGTVFGAEPNTQTCPVCLGLPGALPVVNAKAVESAIRIGLALGCSIAESCRFARKNYFYPDMPKNFQTSQYDEPISFDGSVEVTLPEATDGADGGPETYTVGIERAHMEEDTGKSTHIGGATGRIHGADHSLVDFNRAGIPLIEIVTKTIEVPPHRAAAVARAYVTQLRDLMAALGVSDVRMDQGSLRCDANVSLKPHGSTELGTRTETKNVNSFRSIERAVTYEIRRQAALLAAGGSITQETRHWHEDTGVTTAGRPKSDADDYRYFPEPDLVPVEPSAELVERLRATLPENPAERRRRLQDGWGFSDLEMRDVVNADAVDAIDETVALGIAPQSARKWWMGELARAANEGDRGLTELGVTPAHVAEVQRMVESGDLNDKLARQVFDGLVKGEGTPAEIVAGRNLALVSDDAALTEAVDRAIAANPDVVAKVQGGKPQAAGALIGAVMKDMRGQADAAAVRRLLDERLGQA